MNVLDSKRIGRYVLYAIGEIILVVIGILLALQINNWNGERLQHKKEISYLKEIRNNLKSDTAKISTVLKFNATKTEAILACSKEIADSKTNHNRIGAIGSRMDILPNFETFIPHDTGFRNMMSAENIELIENDSLRNKISNFYEYDFSGGTQERIQQLTRQFIDYTMPRIATKEHYRDAYQLDLDIPSMDEIEINKDPFIISYLFGMLAMIESQDDLLFEFKQEITSIIHEINEELKKEAD